MAKQAKILVVGAGAIGGVTAALIKRAGYQVELICKYPELVEQLETKGLQIEGIKGSFWQPLAAKAQISELQEKKDIVLLATKATDMLQAAKELLPFLHEQSRVVSLQNGICEPALAELLGKERVVGCVVGWGASMLKPGHLEMTSEGEFVLGTLDGSAPEGLKDIQEMLAFVVPVELSKDIIAHLYSKLIINSCITSLGAVSGLYLGEMLRQKRVRQLFIGIMREAMQVADALQLQVPPYANKLDYYKFLGSEGLFSSLKRHLTILFIGMKFRRLKSSSLQSLERGKPTEIDYLNGYICQQARRFGIDTPINDRVVAQIREIEAGKRKISPENFLEFPNKL